MHNVGTLMLCPNCNNSVREGDRFCPNCGKTLQSSDFGKVAFSSSPSSSSPLLSLNHLIMLWDTLSFHLNYQFQDSSGMLLGETKGEMKFPLMYTLYDTTQQPVLSVDGTRVRGLLYIYLIHDAAGNVLASLKQKSSFMSRKYGIITDGLESMLLSTDASASNCKLEDINSGNVLASGHRDMGLKTSKVEIDISDIEKVDHRIVLGGMLLVYYFARR